MRSLPRRSYLVISLLFLLLGIFAEASGNKLFPASALYTVTILLFIAGAVPENK